MFAKPSKCGPSVTLWSFLFHLTGFVWYCVGMYYDRTVYIMPSYASYGGRYQYLTLLTAHLLWISTAFATFADAVQLITKSLESKTSIKEESASVLIRIRDELMSFWAFTLGAFVPVMFWGIAAVDLEEIYNEQQRKISPLWGWHNHFMHTVPILYVFIAAVCVNYLHLSMTRVILNVLTLGCGYIAWMYVCAQANGHWPYAFLEHLSTNQFIAFMVFSHIVFISFYLIGRKLAASTWDKKRRDQYLKNKNL